VGFDNLIGHLAGGFDAWAKAGKEFDTVKEFQQSNLQQM
jgi:hypothetical protein